MQQTLFEPMEPTRGKSKQALATVRHGDETQDAEPLQTLFGPVETKAQARRRAQRIVQLLGAIEEAPEAIKCCEHHITMLEYFVQRSLRVQLDPNDRDGLQRLIGETDEVLTQEDRVQMRSNRQIWRPYASVLHPKEVDYLREVQKNIREDLTAIAAGVEESQSELAALKALGPLAEDVAQRYALTPAGERSTCPLASPSNPS